MIKIEAKYLCCGCGACEQKCPLKCIQLVEDDEGFLYPSVDESVCVIVNYVKKFVLYLIKNGQRWMRWFHLL